ncbi:zinc ribbon domain-containing protein [Hydrogenoanaerobacterium sp.]|uniref:zinc ribbon domain-containing protein n=1 Tax=Hydrogenoanaerobacterium sp. TaxID=2953763 RepID=UPI00289A6CF2|nr:zinc ribbon domain-containing protein [Hydrogenoanaerobacterium sp.]
MKFCPYCGELLPTPKAKFCPECGQRLVLPAESVQQPPASTVRTQQTFQEETKRPTPEELWQQAISEEQEEISFGVQQAVAPDSQEQTAPVQKTVTVAVEENDPYSQQCEEPYEEMKRPDPAERWNQAISEEEEEISFGVQQAVAADSQEQTAPVQKAVTVAVEEDDPYTQQYEEPYEEHYDQQAEWEFAIEGFADEFEEEPEQEDPKQGCKRKPIKQPKTIKAKSGIGKIWLIVLLVVILLGGVAGFTGLKMNANKAPEKAVDAFVGAVSSGDTKYVLANIETSGSGLTSAEDAKKMCAAMMENLDMTVLKAHLLASEGDWAGGNDDNYSCFTLKQTKNNLFSQKFVVKVSPVQVNVQTDIKDITLYVDDKKVSAEQTEDGLLLKLSPGTHTVRATYQKYGSEYELGKSEFTSFSATESTTVSVAKNLASAEIELAGIETGLQVLVNGSKADLASNGGFITISPAFEGMKVTVKCDQYSQDFSITGEAQTLSVDYIKELETKYPNAENPSEMTNRQLINSLAPRFYAFYQSYLEAINKWDKNLIKNVSEAYLADLVTKMEAYNQGLLFDFHGLTFDRRSISRSIKDDELYATFDVQADYNYAEKTDSSKWFAGGNFQTVTMHYNAAEGKWEIFGTVIKDSITFSAETFTIKP